MRGVAVLALLVFASACGEPGAPAARASQPDVLMGRYEAVSDAARQAAGDVSIRRGGLVFDRGVTLYTRILNPRRGADAVARGGDTYAALTRGAADVRVELRRITEQHVGEGARVLCGDVRPTYAALAYEEDAAAVTLLVFAGEEPPGPRSTSSRLCAAFAFEAADGARTQGALFQ